MAPCGVLPLGFGWEASAPPGGVRLGLEPAHAGARMLGIGLAALGRGRRWDSTLDPCPASIRPEGAIRIPTLIDEPLERRVRHLIPIDPVAAAQHDPVR